MSPVNRRSVAIADFLDFSTGHSKGTRVGCAHPTNPRQAVGCESEARRIDKAADRGIVDRAATSVDVVLLGSTKYVPIMRIRDTSSRHVRLSLTDFAGDPAALAATLDAPDVQFWRKGDRLQRETIRPKRVPGIWVSYGFDASVAWDDAFAGLVQSVGGMETLEQFLLRVDARDQHIHFQIPTRNSPHQENNYLSRTTLDALQGLNLWVGFDFSHYDPSDPTHLDLRPDPVWTDESDA